MKLVVIALIFLVLYSALKNASKLKQRRTSAIPAFSNSKFVSKSPLSEREQGCYYRLVANLGDDFVVLPQVAFSAFLTTQGGSKRDNYTLNNTMRQKVADFLICSRDFRVLAVIELDDRSHIGKEEQDKMRDAKLKEAGLRTFRLPHTPDNQAVQNLADILKRLDRVDGLPVQARVLG